MKFLKISLLVFLILMLLVACKSEEVEPEPIKGEKSFVGNGQEWNAEYLYDSEHHSDWIELTYNGSLDNDFDLNQIDIEVESRDTLTKGNLGDMETKIENNKIAFLVGMINYEMYPSDEVKLRINQIDNQDIIILKAE